MIEEEPFFTFFDNVAGQPSTKRRRTIPDTALVPLAQIIRVLKPPETHFRGREALMLFRDLC